MEYPAATVVATPDAVQEQSPHREEHASVEASETPTNLGPSFDPLTIQETTSSQDIHPDGGVQAWLCVAGSLFCLLPTYGMMQSGGTLQEYLETNQLKDYTARDVGWIISVFTFLALFLGIQVGPLFDRYGPRFLNLLGSLIYVAQWFLLAECKKYWQFILCLGILGGIGAALVSTIAMSIISNWFLKRRGLAMGITMAGSSCGGITFPILLRSIFPRLGWTWSMRIVGFIVLASLIPGNLWVRPNPRLSSQHHQNTNNDPTLSTSPSESQVPLPPPPPKRRAGTLNFSAFASVPFTFFTIALTALEFVIFGATGILPTYASIAHFPISAGFTVIAVTNGASILGRILPGLAADYIGPFNVLCVMIVLTLICMLAIWLPFGSTSLAAFYVFAVCWGLGTGSFLSMIPVCVGKTCDTRDYGRYFGTAYFVVSFATLLTVPLTAQVLQTAGPTPMVALYIAVLGVGGLCTAGARWAILEWKWNWKTII